MFPFNGSRSACGIADISESMNKAVFAAQSAFSFPEMHIILLFINVHLDVIHLISLIIIIFIIITSIFLFFLYQLEEHVTYLVCEVELIKKKKICG